MNEIGFPKNTDSVEVSGVVFTHAEILNVVQDFYTQIPLDPLLKIPFRSVQDWPNHIARLTHFWWIRFGGKPYLFSEYNPVAKHFFAGFNDELLKQWLSLFRTTLQSNLSHAQSELWATISEKTGHSLSIKNELFRKQHDSK